MIFSSCVSMSVDIAFLPWQLAQYHRYYHSYERLSISRCSGSVSLFFLFLPRCPLRHSCRSWDAYVCVWGGGGGWAHNTFIVELCPVVFFCCGLQLLWRKPLMRGW
jgi:hypothetical protein